MKSISYALNCQRYTVNLSKCISLNQSIQNCRSLSIKKREKLQNGDMNRLVGRELSKRDCEFLGGKSFECKVSRRLPEWRWNDKKWGSPSYWVINAIEIPPSQEYCTSQMLKEFSNKISL